MAEAIFKALALCPGSDSLAMLRWIVMSVYRNIYIDFSTVTLSYLCIHDVSVAVCLPPFMHGS